MNKLIFKLFYLKNALGSFLLLSILILAGCEPTITGKQAAQIPKETAKNPEAYFCPKEDCGKVLEGHIESADFSVYCALYDIDLGNAISSLARKSKTADVKLVMDSSNYEYQVKGEAVKMNRGERQLMHDKFCVIDGYTVITGSFNPTDNDNNYNNNNIVVAYSEILAKNYGDEFEELWNGEFGNGNSVEYPLLYINNMKIENYFCPEDGCSSRIINLIKNAKSSVYFMSFSFTSEDIANAIIGRGNLDIRGIFDSQQASNKFSQLNRLKGFGIKVKKDANKYKMHHKVFIIDNSTVITGSFNPTLSADTKNDENLLIIHDKKIANAFLREFDSLWQK